MNTTSLKKSSTVQTYADLVKRVREAIAAGKERALDAVERESVRAKWEVGKLIQEHILLNKGRADYGAKVIHRLSGDLKISNTELKYMREFARAYPIGPPVGQFSWGKIRLLLSVNEVDQRQEVAERALKGGWSRGALRHEIKKLKSTKQITVSEASAEELLAPQKGKLDTYRMITGKTGPWAGKLAVDLGFANYLALDSRQARKFKDRDIVEISATTLGGSATSFGGASSLPPEGTVKGILISPDASVTSGVRASSPRQKMAGLLAMTVTEGASEADLFTYRAYLLQVTDADTLWCLIDLGFDFVTQQHLRLRGIDCPEITTREGGEAKRFVEGELKKTSQIIITTTKSDKYDRYLVDVFYDIKGTEHFLNNRLLERGLATRA